MTDVGILGGDAVRGDPNGLATVARFLSDTAHEIDDVRRALDRDALYGSWSGTAAEAFRRYHEEAPDDLDKAARSYRLASETVSTYSNQLRDAHARAQDLANRLAALEGQAANLDGRIRNQHSLIDAARRQYTAATPQTKAHALQVLNQRQRDLHSLTGERGSVQSQIGEIRRQASANRQDLDNHAQWAQGQLHEASKLGLRNNIFSWADRHPLVRFVAGTVIDAAKIFQRIGAYIQDPSWAHLSDILDSVGAILSIVAFVAVVALAAIAIVGSGGAAIPFLMGALTFATVAGRYVSVTKLGVDGYRKFGLHDPDVSYADLAADGVDVGLSFASKTPAEQGALKENWSHVLDDPDAAMRSKTWAAAVVVFHDGLPKITKEQMGVQIVKHVGKDMFMGPKDFVEKQVKDLIDDNVPIVGKDLDKVPARRLLHSAENVLKHSITIPDNLITIKPSSLLVEEAR